MRSNEVYRSVEAWLSRGAGDLQTATYAPGQPNLAWVACNHSQQAAEKALKAYLVWLGQVHVPRIHDLEKLAGIILEHAGRRAPVGAVQVLNRYSAVRYPEEGDPDPQEAQQALDCARELVSFVRAALAEEE